MKHIAVSGDSFIVYGHDETPDPAMGTIYPAENTPVLTAADDEVCEQETGYVIENGVAKLLNSLRKKTVEEMRAERIEYIKQRRNVEESRSPFEFDASLFDYDSLSRERINSAVLSSTIAAVSGVASNTVVAEWRLYDNTTREMTIADWMGFKQAEVKRSSDVFAIAVQLKADIDAADNIPAVNAVDWPAPTWNFPAGNDSVATWNTV